jgi:hypothetical protein
MVRTDVRTAGILSAILLGLAVIPSLRAGTDPAMAQGPQIEGAWVVTIAAPGQPATTALHTYTPDGGVLVSSPTAQRSTGHGAWVRTGPREFGRTWLQLRFDERGAFAGTVKVRSTIRLNEAQDEWVGLRLTSDLFDAAGKHLSTVTGAVDRGKRIRVDAP